MKLEGFWEDHTHTHSCQLACSNSTIRSTGLPEELGRTLKVGHNPPRQGSNPTCNGPDPGQMPPLLANPEEWGAHHLEKLFVTLETTVIGRKFLNLSLALPVGEVGAV